MAVKVTVTMQRIDAFGGDPEVPLDYHRTYELAAPTEAPALIDRVMEECDEHEHYQMPLHGVIRVREEERGHVLASRRF